MGFRFLLAAELRSACYLLVGAGVISIAIGVREPSLPKALAASATVFAIVVALACPAVLLGACAWWLVRKYIRVRVRVEGQRLRVGLVTAGRRSPTLFVAPLRHVRWAVLGRGTGPIELRVPIRFLGLCLGHASLRCGLSNETFADWIQTLCSQGAAAVR